MKVPMKKSWLLMLALTSSLALVACTEKLDNAADEKTEVSEGSEKRGVLLKKSC